MQNVLENIDYKGVFKYFGEICCIPRGSGNNQGISDYLMAFAKKRGLFCIQDAFLNVIIIKEASKEQEDRPAVIIQGHMDMVCEKREEISHDFTTQPLDLRIEGDFVYADGTTLGGDDGIAVAYALALLDDETVIHPRLEVIITTDEETGMHGAIGLDVSPLKGRYMLNIDSEEEGILLSSSAGGLTGTCEFPLRHLEAKGNLVSLKISGLQGGHSGTEIKKNRCNASVLMGRLLFDLGQELNYSLIKVIGGKKDNAIPREAYAEIMVDEQDSALLEEYVKNLKDMYQFELAGSEPGLELKAEELENSCKKKVIQKEDKNKLIFMLLHAPNGVQVMSSNIDGLVESSLNLGILKIEEDKAEFCYSVRSSSGSYKKYLSNKLKSLSEFIGGTYYIRGEYEPWEYRKESSLRELLVKVYTKDYGTPPKIEAIHAGLECGILAGKIKDLDIVSFGPDIFDIHTPEEKLSISSAKRVYDYLLHVLEEICE